MSGRRRSRAGSPDYRNKLKKAARRAQSAPLEPIMGAIVFFDMPGSTRMMKQEPRTAIPAMLRHNAMCRVIIEPNGCEIVKELGDGLMVRFTNAGKAVYCAIKVIQNLRKHGNGICTKATVAFGTLWDVENPSGYSDVYGTPVHVSSRMESHAAANTILIDAKDKEMVVEWLGRPRPVIRRRQIRLKDYPDRKIYAISVK